ncbi:hypothetical protein NQ318_003485 [Aromia moschata]|uniref:Uncharacterized protein n=1 Tax=Aromia moschata TaxID=1265417 RepID=A0AAV8YWZ7_9CUCU|nr:hypothetical protein NQ318_003485 [Aromia moschata]
MTSLEGIAAYLQKSVLSVDIVKCQINVRFEPEILLQNFSSPTEINLHKKQFSYSFSSVTVMITVHLLIFFLRIRFYFCLFSFNQSLSQRLEIVKVFLRWFKITILNVNKTRDRLNTKKFLHNKQVTKKN